MKYSVSVPLLFLFIFLYPSCQTGTEPLSIGFPEPDDPDTIPADVWNKISPGLHASFGSIDNRYSRSTPPDISISNKWEGTAWRGERINAQLVLWTPEDIEKIKIVSTDLEGIEGHKIESSNINIRLVRYVITDEFLGGYGWRDPDTIPAHLVADPFENTTSCDLPANTSRPVWITIDIPLNTPPDQYKGTIIINYSKNSKIKFEIDLLVYDLLLPPPSGWTYHLDLWLNPFAIARFYEVELWSKEFWDYLEPYVTMLAQAGQKCITTCIIDDPWKALPVYDGYKSMIKRIKKSNVQWEYDYSVFDRYVQFTQNCGITEQINCFTMAVWGDEYRYFDEDSSGYVILQTAPGREEYSSFWKPFLIDFSSHLKEKGWIEKTCIAMDERSPDQMKNIMALLDEYAPDIKVAMAIDRIIPELNAAVYDLSSIAHNPLEASLIRERIEKGLPTTFYTCCAPPEHPNNQTFSPPADATWLGWYAAAQGYTGFLRFAYCSWTKDPLMDSRYQTWPAGDCYQIYPGPRSSIRFERLREGIQDYEKIRILQEKYSKMDSEGGKANLKKLNNYLQNFTLEALHNTPSEVWIKNGKKILDELSE